MLSVPAYQKMSVIGSFYLIDDDKRDGVVRAAEAQALALKKKRYGFLPPKLPLNPDPFWSYVDANAEQLDQYPYSGHLLLYLELAPGVLGSEDDVGTKLSQITDSTFISFRPRDAAASIRMLEAADFFSDDAIKMFLAEGGNEEDYSGIVSPIQDSVNFMKKWLGSVSQGKTGILSIG